MFATDSASGSRPVFRLSVKVILRNAEGKVLALRRSSSSVYSSGKWDLPGGKVDPGESFDEALVREVLEETGLTARLTAPFETAACPLPGNQVVFLVMLADAEPGAVRVSREHDDYRWVAPGDLPDVDFGAPLLGVARHYAQDVDARTPPGPPKADKPFVTPETLEMHIRAFEAQLPALKQLKAFLEDILVRGIKPRFPLSQIAGRAKGVVSFADKIVKKAKYADPLRDITDLVGLRVIVHLPSEVDAVGRFIRDTFHIDEANSLDMLSRLGVDKFGYRSVHFIVEITPDKPAGVEIPKALIGRKAEIQVRTIAQHAWGDIGHDRLYKSDCEVSEYWRREANRVAALLEEADGEFQRLVDGVAFYEAHRPRCATPEIARERIALTETIRKHAPGDLTLALRQARLAVEIGDWDQAVQIAGEVDARRMPVLMSLHGYALCKKAKTDAQRRAGVKRMEEAVSEAPRQAEPHLLLAEVLGGQGRHREALDRYRLAFEAEPGHPGALSGFIREKAIAGNDSEFISVAGPAIRKAIERCRELVSAKADLPRAMYRVAEFLQLLGADEEWDSLATFANAVRLTSSPDELRRALGNVALLAAGEKRRNSRREDVECARRFLAVALRARFPKAPLPEGVDYPPARAIKGKGPFVIVAGGCDPHYEGNMQSYKSLLKAAFGDFVGVVISGGTTQGISGLVAEIAVNSGGRIRSLGYPPPLMPTDDTATKDDRYDELRKTDSTRKFSPMEPIQYWLDLMASGVAASDVRLLGINGGRIASLEYRFALALGARVALLQDSGREAERLVQECSADPPANLIELPRDPMTIRAFLRMGVEPSRVLSDEILTAAAQQVHEDFLDQRRYSHSDPVMQPWAKLRADLQESNRSQMRYMENILGAAGFGIRPAGVPPNDPRFTPEEIERMAEMEHGRWVLERIQSGWRYDRKKDAETKRSPYLVGWEALKKEIRKYDCEAVELWPEVLAKAELEIYRLPNDPPTVSRKGARAARLKAPRPGESKESGSSASRESRTAAAKGGRKKKP